MEKESTDKIIIKSKEQEAFNTLKSAVRQKILAKKNPQLEGFENITTFEESNKIKKEMASKYTGATDAVIENNINMAVESVIEILKVDGKKRSKLLKDLGIIREEK